MAHRQLQLSTGPATALKPRFTGPFIISQLLPDGCSALIENLNNGNIMKAHFTNLQIISFHAGIGNRVDGNFDDRLIDMLSNKQTLPTVTRKHLQLEELPPQSPPTLRQRLDSAQSEESDDNPLEIDSQESHFPPDDTFGTLDDNEATSQQELQQYYDDLQLISQLHRSQMQRTSSMPSLENATPTSSQSSQSGWMSPPHAL